MPKYMLDEVNLDDIEEPSNHKHHLKRHIKGTGYYEGYGCNKYKDEFCRLGSTGKNPE
jgi:hypothetical protein